MLVAWLRRSVESGRADPVQRYPPLKNTPEPGANDAERKDDTDRAPRRMSRDVMRLVHDTGHFVQRRVGVRRWR